MKRILISCACCLLTAGLVSAQPQAQDWNGLDCLTGSPSNSEAVVEHHNQVISKKEKTLKTQWAGQRIGILGDSMTDKRTLGPEATLWWEYLSQLMGFGATYNYGISGHQWHQIYAQAQKLYAEHAGEVDAIFIFAGTNDYNGGCPIGEFFQYEEIEVEAKGVGMTLRNHRTPVMSDTTFCGRLNQALCYLKERFPDAQIVMMTPIHRGYAKFNAKNVQPDEFYCNARGLFLEDYVEVMKKAAAYWSVPVADLYAESGLLPNLDSHSRYINKPATDRLHPSTEGEYRIAKLMQYRLLGLPSGLRLKTE